MKVNFTKKTANDFLAFFADCWFEENEDIVYLAVVKSKSDELLYNIEMGIKDGKNTNVKLINYSDIPLNCKLSNKQIEAFEILNKIGKQINQSQKITVPVNHVDPIMLHHISNHKIRPMLAGCGIEAESYSNTSGTLGAFLRISPYEDKIFIITNFHVLFEFKEIKNELIFQPNNSSNDYLAVIGKYKFGFFGKTDDSNFIDVAFIQMLNNKHQNDIKANGFIWSDLEFDKNEPYIKGIELPECGMDIEVYGKTSSRSDGKIISDNAYVRIEDNYLKGSSKIFKNQILLNRISKPGDSGSVIINKLTKKAVGLVFAGDNKKISVANNLDHIFKTAYKINNQKEKINLIEFLT